MLKNKSLHHSVVHASVPRVPVVTATDRYGNYMEELRHILYYRVQQFFGYPVDDIVVICTVVLLDRFTRPIRASVIIEEQEKQFGSYIAVNYAS